MKRNQQINHSIPSNSFNFMNLIWIELIYLLFGARQKKRSVDQQLLSLLAPASAANTTFNSNQIQINLMEWMCWWRSVSWVNAQRWFHVAFINWHKAWNEMKWINWLNEVNEWNQFMNEVEWNGSKQSNNTNQLSFLQKRNEEIGLFGCCLRGTRKTKQRNQSKVLI